MKDGFALPETLVALALGTAIAGSVYGVVAMHRSAYLAGLHQVEGLATVRLATGLISAELRGLDPAGGDLLAISTTGITYRAGRSLYVTCREPDPRELRVTVASTFFGLRPLDPELDSILIYVSADYSAGRPAGWVSADVRSIAWGRRCPGGAESLTLEVAGIPRGTLAAAGAGSPVRGVTVWEIRVYGDSRRQWWLGMRRLPKGGVRPPAIQPVLGPLAPDGVAFRYYDRQDQPVHDLQAVVSVGLTILPPTSEHAGFRPPPVTWRVALRGAGNS